MVEEELGVTIPMERFLGEETLQEVASELKPPGRQAEAPGKSTL